MYVSGGPVSGEMWDHGINLQEFPNKATSVEDGRFL